MNRLDLRIVFRAFFKNKWYNLLNIIGLSLGLAAFIFVTLYVDNETGYDRWNKNFDHIFLVEREMPTGTSPFTPGKLAEVIKNECPEVEEIGRTNTALFQVPFYTSSGRYLIKQWVGADYSIAKILDIKPEGFSLNPKSIAPTILLSHQTANVLFPGKGTVQNKVVNMVSKSGMPMKIAGVVQEPPGNSNFTFDCIGFSRDITQGKDQSYETQIYETFLLVRPNTDIDLLTKKIDKIYRTAALTDTSQVAKQAVNQTDKPTIFLDALRNLHLKPHYASHASDQMVNGLIALAIFTLIVTCVNFTNLYLSQASKRAKEIGIKKVSGVIERQLIVQFLLEIFLQCVVASIVALVLVIIGLPYFNKLLHVDLLISGINLRIIFQLSLTLVVLTVVAGAYPALTMARFKPVDVLRGDQLSKIGKFFWIRSGITILQFTFAVGFVIILIIINQQVRFMRTEDPGFTAKQVLYIDNLGLYNTPQKFEPVRSQIESIAGVEDVTVATNVPGGILPASHEFMVQGKAYSMNTIGVDYRYFKALNIGLKEGQVFDNYSPGDTTKAVVNETAVKSMGLNSPIGTMISGCGTIYKVVGVVKDVKDYGFEESTKPTIYLINDNCGLSKTQILIRADGNAIPGLLSTLNSRWRTINKLDGDNFNYHFLDQLYGQLFDKQEQLQSVLSYFSAMAIAIAALGLFALAGHSLNLRIKEIAIRKVFGADKQQLTILLSKPFFYIVLFANLIAWPVAFVIANKWLETFAYRVHLSVKPFAIAIIVSIVIVAITVCLQIIKVVRFNPAAKLKV